MSNGKYAAVILAAGFSSRMKDFKPLMTINGITVADRVISLFRDAGTDVILVTGWRGDELVNGIDRHDITIAENPDYETGMLSSVQAGVRNIGDGCTSFFLMPVDIPLVRPATLQRLLAAGEKNPEVILYPVFNGKRGHPPLIPVSLIPEIINWNEDTGLNAILAGHRDIQVELPVVDSNVLADADDRDDFSRLLEKFKMFDIPNEDECRTAFEIAGTPENVQRHCRKVADIAVAIGEALEKAGTTVNIREVQAAALLHDIAKGHPNHGEEGANILENHGFGRIGKIVAVHQDLVDDIDSVDIETKLVYFADKIVSGETVVSVENRFYSSEEKYGHIPEAAEKIQMRKNRALRVKKEIETKLGYPIERAIVQSDV